MTRPAEDAEWHPSRRQGQLLEEDVTGNNHNEGFLGKGVECLYETPSSPTFCEPFPTAQRVTIVDLVRLGPRS